MQTAQRTDIVLLEVRQLFMAFVTSQADGTN